MCVCVCVLFYFIVVLFVCLFLDREGNKNTDGNSDENTAVSRLVFGRITPLFYNLPKGL